MKRILFTSILIITSNLFTNAQSDCEGITCETQVTESTDIWSNAIYTGCIGGEFDRPNGYGIQISGNQKYEGCWKDGKRHGQGTQTFASGDKYEGEWKDGKEHGQGTLTKKDGFKIYFVYENGSEVDSWSFLDSRPSPEDIICNKKSFSIALFPQDNHEYFRVSIGNKTKMFLDDSGATHCSMTRSLFNSLPKELVGEKLYEGKAQIADGSYVSVDYYLIKEIMIQGIVIKNVIFSVVTGEGSNLIGQNFWNKFSKKNEPKKGAIKVYK